MTQFDGWGAGPRIDPAGDYLDTYQLINGGRHYFNPTQNYYLVNGARHPIGGQNSLLDAISNSLTPAATPPQFQFSFDTIGQVIPRSIGNVRLLVHPIWAQGIVDSGDTTISNTQTFAGAVCAPIDQDEEVEIGRIWERGSLILNAGVAITPPGWTDADAALLAASLASVIMYPGNETQLPDPTILADKGADKTPAFRGLRYFIFPNFPVKDSLPQLSVEFNRTNNEPEDDGAVEFLSGSE